MSHITLIKAKVRSLDALAAAAAALGMEFRRDQRSFHWYGTFLGDSRSGLEAARQRGSDTFGQCEHAIRAAGHREGDYEIGVVRASDGDGYQLMVDTWGPGRRLADSLGGDRLPKLVQEANLVAAEQEVRSNPKYRGYSMQRELLAGSRTVRLRLTKR